MPVTRLNHAVLFVADLARSLAFYEGVLHFRRIAAEMPVPGAAFLLAPGSTNDHDLGLFEIGSSAGPSQAGRATVGLYHLAWEVDTLGELDRLRDVLDEAGALAGATDHGTTKSLYARDPDGLELELAWIVPSHAIDEAALAGRSQLRPLDLAREIERYGADVSGGLTPA
jgi:catechol 2,3-dioxygenase-like lactoylglutathione lyase family enzyme